MALHLFRVAKSRFQCDHIKRTTTHRTNNKIHEMRGKKRNKLIKQSHTASQIELSKFSGCERFLFSHVRTMVGWLVHLIWPRGVVAEDRRNQVSNVCKLL